MKTNLSSRILYIVTIALASICIAYTTYENKFFLRFDLSFFLILGMTTVLFLTSVKITAHSAIDMASSFVYLAILTQPILNVYIIIFLSLLITRTLSIILKNDYFVLSKIDIVLFYNISAQCIGATITYQFVGLITNSFGLQQLLSLLIFVLVNEGILELFFYLVYSRENTYGISGLKMALLTFTLDFFITAISFLLITSYAIEGLVLFSLFVLLISGSIYNFMSGAEINKNLIVDSLTKAYNRRYFDEYMSDYLKQKKMFTLLFFDLDDFKTINDNYGHLVGDKVLVAFVDVIKGYLRKNDKLFRYAGDEFCIIFDNRVDAVSFQNKMNCKGLSLDYAINDIKIQRSISIGILNYDGCSYSTLDELIHSVDERMYSDKRFKKQRKDKASLDQL